MTVDVIVPVYNGEKYLTYSIDSLINQEVNFNKIIIVDDASNDQSSHIIKQYLHDNPDIVAIFNPVNVGLGETLKIGLNVSESDFICILAHDDILPRDYLLKIRSYLTSDVSIAHSAFERIDEYGNPLYHSSFYPYNYNYVRKFIGKDFLWLMPIGNYISTVGIMLNRKMLRHINLFQLVVLIDHHGNPIRTYSEYDTWLKLSMIGKTIYIDDIKSKYRTHSENMSSKLKFTSLDLGSKLLAFSILIKKNGFLKVIFYLFYIFIPMIFLKVLVVIKSRFRFFFKQ